MDVITENPYKNLNTSYNVYACMWFMKGRSVEHGKLPASLSLLKCRFYQWLLTAGHESECLMDLCPKYPVARGRQMM